MMPRFKETIEKGSRRNLERTYHRKEKMVSMYTLVWLVYIMWRCINGHGFQSCLISRLTLGLNDKNIYQGLLSMYFPIELSSWIVVIRCGILRHWNISSKLKLCSSSWLLRLAFLWRIFAGPLSQFQRYKIRRSQKTKSYTYKRKWKA